MAKIANLTVGTIKIANNAITGTQHISGSSPIQVTVSNPLVYPTTVTAAMLCYRTLASASASVVFNLTVTRTRDSMVLINRQQGVSSGTGYLTVSNGAFDITATSSETYRAQGSYTLTDPNGGSSASINDMDLNVLYKKR